MLTDKPLYLYTSW